MLPLLLLHPQLSTMSSSSPDSISVDTSLDMEDNSSGCEDIVAEGGAQFGRLKHLTNWPPVDILFQDVTQTVPDVTVGEWVIVAAVCCAGRGEWELKGWLRGKRSVEMTPLTLQLYRNGNEIVAGHRLFSQAKCVDQQRQSRCIELCG